MTADNHRILDRIDSPDDLKSLDTGSLEQLAEEIRVFLIETVSRCGGHLAPNLGVVELTLALHRVFHSPTDQIVWDVGHQAYVHKILTGRKARFGTLRQYGGISGFPKRSESPHDAFGAGHASTSISAALGLAAARDLAGKQHHVIAVVGDGALTGGLAYEGLNNAGASRRNLIVVLNDNAMSISRNVGAMSKYLTQIISAPFYNRLKRGVWDWTGKLPKKSIIRGVVQRMEQGLKTMVVPGVLFEKLGFRYFGPVDGHDLETLIRLFEEVGKIPGPILVHLVTKKGKGYKFAEEDATKFHGLGTFCPETGDPVKSSQPSYTEIFGQGLVELARRDEKILAVCAAMADGTGLVPFAKEFPGRFFDVGIAEGHAVTFAAGLAASGFKPIVAIYSTFLQRAYDQIIHDVALQNLPVVFALDRAGLVGEDGPTHHGSFDLSYLRLIPNLVIMTPKDENDLRDMLFTAFKLSGPSVIRYPRGESCGVPLKSKFDALPLGKAEILREGKDAAVLAVGDRVLPALEASRLLEQRGYSVRVVNMRFVKPLDRELVENTLRTFPLTVTVENNTVLGGFGGAVAEMAAGIPNVNLRCLGLPDAFVTHGDRRNLWRETGLDAESIAAEIEKFIVSPSNGRKPFLKLKTS